MGGIGNHAYNLALFLARQNFEVSVVADLHGINNARLKQFKSIVPFTFIPVVRSRISSITYCKRLVKILWSGGKNEIIICSGKFSLWTVSVMKLLFYSKKYVAVVHGSELDLKNYLAKRMTNFSLKKFHSIVAVSNYTKSFLPINVYAKTKVIPNGVNNDEFESVAKKAGDFMLNTNVELPIITIGSVTERKGQINVIKALPVMLRKFPNLHYYMVGKPLIENEVQQLTEVLDLKDKITFCGAVKRAQLIEFLNKSIIKIMLSNHTANGDFEGFGISILEANALGKPVIASNAGGLTDAVKNGFNGKLVNANNADEITNALQEILDNYKRYSENAFLWAKQHDWSLIIKEYIKSITAL